MDDTHRAAQSAKGSRLPTDAEGSALPRNEALQEAIDNNAFQSQLGFLTPGEPLRPAAYPNVQPLDLRSLGHALPSAMQSPMQPQGYPLQPQVSNMPFSQPMYGQQQPNYRDGQSYLVAPLPQGQLAFHQRAVPHMQAQYPGPPIHTQRPANVFGSHGPNFSPSSPNMLNAPFTPTTMLSPVQGNFPQHVMRSAEPAPVPSYPRGPPRKPRQSGHALWVGNLPPAATVGDLKDHFSRDATSDIESLFLISKSNCAFVNYRSEAACAAAMNRFHDSRFHGVRLVCRLRRGSVANNEEPSKGAPPDGHTPDGLPSSSKAADTDDASLEDDDGPTIVASSRVTRKAESVDQPSVDGDRPSTSSHVSGPGADEDSEEKVPEKFFVIKSLTVQDLESSIRNGIWATQNHNEATLNKAFKRADNVYLIFSANKSGEYFGYARMASLISGQPVSLNNTAAAVSPSIAPAPYAIPTPATATAPKGRIIDDSGRGTIFWEADRSDEAAVRSRTPPADGEESPHGSDWGREFSIEWMSTTRLPFYKTRGLRNPWNSNREVKIARDGTELEPSVGRRLVQMFHRPPLGYGQAFSAFR